MVQKSGEETTWDVKGHVNNGIIYISSGAGFLPLTVGLCSRVKTQRGENRSAFFLQQKARALEVFSHSEKKSKLSTPTVTSLKLTVRP